MKKLYALALSIVLLALAACSDNLFGNNSPNKGDDVKSLRIDAENAFRKGDYKGSYEICQKIIEKDPKASFGYYGMAKAGLWQHGVNPFSVFSVIKPKDDECPFIGETVKVQNGYFQAMKKVTNALSELSRRDSLTALYEFHINAKENKASSDIDMDKRLADFRKTFCDNNANCSDTASGGKKREPFPLSDREFQNSYFGGILVLSVFSEWFLSFFDTRDNGCIARRGPVGVNNPGIPDNLHDHFKWLDWGCAKDKFGYDLPLEVKCSKDEKGNIIVSVDSKQMLEELKKELDDYFKNMANCTADCANMKIPDDIAGLNSTIDNFDGRFEKVESAINGLGFSIDNPDENPETLKDEIDKFKAYASFYKVGTRIDEDGDGCIDEDILDGQDNDGDGLANANSRLASIDENDPLYGINAINNSMYGNNPYRDAENWEYNKPVQLPAPVTICSNPNCSIGTELRGNEETGMVTVIGFTQKEYPDGSRYWTTRDMDLKLAVAQDTICGSLKYSLQERKELVGGCWPYYDSEKFLKYWLKRELAHPDERAQRVHPNCLTCQGEACFKKQESN